MTASCVTTSVRPERHVGPRLAARWPVVELAELGAAPVLVGEPPADARGREPVEHAELAVPQALVGPHGHVDAGFREREVRGLPGAHVRRAPHDVGRPVLAQPVRDGGRLLAPAVRERGVGVPGGELELVRAVLLGARRREVAEALAVAHQRELDGAGVDVRGGDGGHRGIVTGHAPPRTPSGRGAVVVRHGRRVPTRGAVPGQAGPYARSAHRE
jgi:hypothetical protein